MLLSNVSYDHMRILSDAYSKTVVELEKECQSLESAKRILATADDLIGYQVRG